MDTIDIPDYDSVEWPELPNGWEYWSGETSNSYCTYNFGTEYEMGGKLAGKHGMGGYFGQVTWDRGRDFYVQIVPITGFDGDDPRYGYSIDAAEFDTLQEAVDAIPEMIENL